MGVFSCYVFDFLFLFLLFLFSKNIVSLCALSLFQPNTCFFVIMLWFVLCSVVFNVFLFFFPSFFLFLKNTGFTLYSLYFNHRRIFFVVVLLFVVVDVVFFYFFFLLFFVFEKNTSSCLGFSSFQPKYTHFCCGLLVTYILFFSQKIIC